jgi:hypothetical protein
VQLRTGELLVCGRISDLSQGGGGNRGSACIVSRDGGVHWARGGGVPATAELGDNECEPALLRNGSILLNMRAGQKRLLARSDDGGATFVDVHVAVDLAPVANCQGSMQALTDGTSNGRLTQLTHTRSTDEIAPHHRHARVHRSGWLLQATQPQPRRLPHAGRVLELGPGRPRRPKRLLIDRVEDREWLSGMPANPPCSSGRGRRQRARERAGRSGRCWTDWAHPVVGRCSRVCVCAVVCVGGRPRHSTDKHPRSTDKTPPARPRSRRRQAPVGVRRCCSRAARTLRHRRTSTYSSRTCAFDRRCTRAREWQGGRSSSSGQCLQPLLELQHDTS